MPKAPPEEYPHAESLNPKVISSSHPLDPETRLFNDGEKLFEIPGGTSCVSERLRPALHASMIAKARAIRDGSPTPKGFPGVKGWPATGVEFQRGVFDKFCIEHTWWLFSRRTYRKSFAKWLEERGPFKTFTWTCGASKSGRKKWSRYDLIAYVVLNPGASNSELAKLSGWSRPELSRKSSRISKELAQARATQALGRLIEMRNAVEPDYLDRGSE